MLACFINLHLFVYVITVLSADNDPLAVLCNVQMQSKLSPKQSFRNEAGQEERNYNAVVEVRGFTCVTAKTHKNLSLPPNNGAQKNQTKISSTQSKGKGKAHPVTRYSFFNLGVSWGRWSTPRPGRFSPVNDPIPNVQEPRWAEVQVWTGVEYFAPIGFRCPDR